MINSNEIIELMGDSEIALDAAFDYILSQKKIRKLKYYLIAKDILFLKKISNKGEYNQCIQENVERSIKTGYVKKIICEIFQAPALNRDIFVRKLDEIYESNKELIKLVILFSLMEKESRKSIIKYSITIFITILTAVLSFLIGWLY